MNGFPIQSTVQLKPGDRLTVGPAEFLVEGPKPRHTVEENVADWLADGDSKVGLLNEQDTTILKGDADFANAAPAAPVPPPSVVPRPRSRRKFASLAEEASDIIRRHLETLERASDS